MCAGSVSRLIYLAYSKLPDDTNDNLKRDFLQPDPEQQIGNRLAKIPYRPSPGSDKRIGRLLRKQI